MTSFYKSKATNDFLWWFNQSVDWILLTSNASPKKSPYITLYCLQQSAEFAFKAVLDSLTGRQIKTRNPYILFKLATSEIPELKNVFPQNIPFEKKLFHFLKPGFILMRGDVELMPANDEMEILSTRIKDMQAAIKTCCLEKINLFQDDP